MIRGALRVEYLTVPCIHLLSCFSVRLRVFQIHLSEAVHCHLNTISIYLCLSLNFTVASFGCNITETKVRLLFISLNPWYVKRTVTKPTNCLWIPHNKLFKSWNYIFGSCKLVTNTTTFKSWHRLRYLTFWQLLWHWASMCHVTYRWLPLILGWNGQQSTDIHISIKRA